MNDRDPAGLLRASDARMLHGAAKIALRLDRNSGGITGHDPSPPCRPLALREVPHPLVVVEAVLPSSGGSGGSGAPGQLVSGVVMVPTGVVTVLGTSGSSSRLDFDYLDALGYAPVGEALCWLQHMDPGVAIENGTRFVCSAPAWIHDDLPVFLVGSGGGGAGKIETRNVGESTWNDTKRLQADTTTGFEIIQGEAGEGASPPGYDVAKLRAASPTQMGAVTKVEQAFAGAKLFNDQIYRTQATALPITAPAMFTTLNLNGFYSAATVTSPAARGSAGGFLCDASGGVAYTQHSHGAFAGPSADTGVDPVITEVTRKSLPSVGNRWYKTAYTIYTATPAIGWAAPIGIAIGSHSSYTPILDEGEETGVEKGGVNFINFFTPTISTEGFGVLEADLYLDTTEATVSGGTVSRPYLRSQYIVTNAAFGARRGTTDSIGIDRDFGDAERPIVRGGVVVGFRTAGSPPSPPSPPIPPPPTVPTTPLPPPDVPATTISGTVSRSAEDGGGPLAGRTVKLLSTGASTTTNAGGGYSFSVAGGGTRFVQVPLGTGELATHSVDGGTSTVGNTASVILSASTHDVDFTIDGVPSAAINVTVQNAVGSTPLSGRTVTVGSTSQTTNGSGQTSFGGLAPGSTNVVLTLGGGESATWAVDTPGASGKGNTATFTSTDGGTHGVTFQVNVAPSPSPGGGE